MRKVLGNILPHTSNPGKELQGIFTLPRIKENSDSEKTLAMEYIDRPQSYGKPVRIYTARKDLDQGPGGWLCAFYGILCLGDQV